MELTRLDGFWKKLLEEIGWHNKDRKDSQE
jgi:hypothetical protein